jgi:hypothetical protein
VFALFDELRNPALLLANPVAWVLIPFQVWMLVDAVRREEWIWAVFIFVALAFSSVMPISALLYYFMVYRVLGPVGGGGGGLTRGFELPGAGERRRIRELQGRIHHLDKARDHLELADIYFSQGKLQQAESSYRASLQRDGSDLDAIAHLGQCLLRLGRAAEALPLLQRVIADDSRHDYGHTLMALAETQSALGNADAAFLSWQRVLENHGYARARVQFAELLMSRGERERARAELNEVISDDLHAPKFQRGRDKPWVRRARTLLGKL